METNAPIMLTDEQRIELLHRARSRRARAEEVRRARVILMLAAGESYAAIQQAVGCFPAYISRWKGRFAQDGVQGLGSRYRGQRPRILTPQVKRGFWPVPGRRRRAGRPTGAPANWPRSWASVI
jgi:hypothetical protein